MSPSKALKLIATLSAALMLASVPIVATADAPKVTLRGALTYDDNINRAERSSEQRDDATLLIGIDASLRKPVTARSGLIAKLALNSEFHSDFGDLDAFELRADLTYLVQPFQGFLAPWFALTGSIAIKEFAASDIRDGSTAAVEFTTGSRLSDRISTRLAYRASDRDASKSRVFEQRLGEARAILDYQFNDQLNFYTKYSYRHGEFVTSAPRGPKFRPVFRAKTADRTFGRSMVAWRIGDGESHTLKLGSKFALAKHTALDLSASHSVTDVEGDNQWRVLRIGLNVQHRF
jgi:hypothetical protein